MGYSLFRTKKVATDKKFLGDAVNLIKENLESNKKNYKVYNIKNFGRLLEVEAYYHEVDEYYKCVGFEVEIESQFSYGNGESEKLSDLDTEVGFYSIWIGKAHEAAPITFETGNRSLGECHRFDNGCGDRVEVIKELASLEEVQQVEKNGTSKKRHVG